MMLTMLFIAMVIVDGVFFIKLNTSASISEWWFHILYFLTLYYFYKATAIQHTSFKESTEIVLTMTGTSREVK